MDIQQENREFSRKQEGKGAIILFSGLVFEIGRRLGSAGWANPPYRIGRGREKAEYPITNVQYPITND